MRVGGRPSAAGAVGERHRQPERRLLRHGARRRIRLGGEQLLLSAHAVAQRSGVRSVRRSALPARRRQRQRCGRRRPAAPAVAIGERGRRLRHRTPCARARDRRASRTSATASPPSSTLGVPRSGSGEDRASAHHESRHRAAAHLAHELRRVGARRAARAHAASAAHAARRADRVRCSRRTSSRDDFASHVAFSWISEPVDGFTAQSRRVHRPQRRSRVARGARGDDALRRDRRGLRSVRRAALRRHARAGRDARGRRPARRGA